jgi:hypothetical protein
MDYCTTSETTASKAVERILIELEQSKSTVKLLKHKIAEYEQITEELEV